jgi:uncharacterized protein YutE (UPF0331/DUF86 family)
LVNREVFRLRLSKLEEYVRRLRKLAEIDRGQLLEDAGLVAQMERWMHLSAEASLDLAQHLISSEGWRTPSTNREAFRILREEGVLDPELATHMEGWAGLRNVLAHLYLEIDYDQLYRTLTEELGQLEDFAAALTRALQKRDSGT